LEKRGGVYGGRNSPRKTKTGTGRVKLVGENRKGEKQGGGKPTVKKAGPQHEPKGGGDV